MARLAYDLFLFDMDGTLVDSARDLAASANAQRVLRDLPPLPEGVYRTPAAIGTEAIILAALGLGKDSPEYEIVKREFLADYKVRCRDCPRLFPGVRRMLSDIEASGAAWGIVTNKPAYLAGLIASSHPMLCGAASVTGSDGVLPLKPAPDLVLKALEKTRTEPSRAILVGDSWRDMAAGSAAGTATAFAVWGSVERPEDCQPRPTITARRPPDLMPLCAFR